MKVGDTAYIVESNRYVREVEIRRCSGGMLAVYRRNRKRTGVNSATGRGTITYPLWMEVD